MKTDDIGSENLSSRHESSEIPTPPASSEISGERDLPPPPAFLKIGLGMNALRKAPGKQRFTERNLKLSEDETWKSTATARMRLIDDLQMYTPLTDDCSELNVSTDRLDLRNLNSVLFLCGGCAGSRFSSDDFRLFQRITKSLESTYSALDTAFKALPSSLRTKKLVGPYATTKEASLVVPIENITGTEDPVELIRFHQLADEYVAIIAELQSVVIEKHAALKSESERKG
jgi:hypothetical protein